MTLGCFVVPQRVALVRANQAFSQDGRLKDAEIEGVVHGVAREVVRVLSKLRATV